MTRITEPLERYLALRRWLQAAPPEHAERRSAERALRRELSKPLLSGEVGSANERITTCFAPDGRILAGAQRTGRVSCWEGTKRVWITPKDKSRAGCLTLANGEAMWWTSLPLRLRSYGRRGPKQRSRKLGRQRARYVASAPDSRRLALAALEPNLLLIASWPEGELQHRVELPTVPHAVTFDRAGRVWVGVGKSQTNSFTTLDSEVLVVDPATGRILHREEVRAGSAPLCLVMDPLSQDTLLGLSSGDLVRLDPQARKLESVPAFRSGDVLNRTFKAGVKALTFTQAGDRLWVAVNSLERGSLLVEIDWKEKRFVDAVPLEEESETLTLSADESLLLRGTRAGRWELWGTGEAP